MLPRLTATADRRMYTNVPASPLTESSKRVRRAKKIVENGGREEEEKRRERERTESGRQDSSGVNAIQA